MGSLFVQVGQCGCQIGIPLNHKLSSSYYSTRLRPPSKVHAIMVDTQPKVIQTVLDKQYKWLDPSNAKYYQYGRGNNWSYGYLHALPPQKYYQDKLPKKQFSHLLPATLDKYIQQNKAISQWIVQRIRRQLQTIDCAFAMNVIASLGGGTGSGLGTKIVEVAKQNFDLQIYSHVVLPNKSGQTPLQAYNCVLSLQSLNQYSSGIFTYENDKMMNLFNLQHKQSSLQQINQHISSTISKMIMINDIPGYSRFYSQMISASILSPELKYLNVFSVQNKKGNWQQLFSKLNQQLKNQIVDPYGEQFSKKQRRELLLHGQLLLVGNTPSQYQKYLKKIKNILNFSQQNCLQVQQHKLKGKQNPCSSVMITNHSNILNYLTYLHDSGSKKFEVGAYLWHYQYVDISQALDSLQFTIDNYQNFAHSQ